MKYRYLLAVSLVAPVLAFCSEFAWASDTCTSCSSEPSFPDAASFLATQGYPSSDYVVLLTWSEQIPDGSGKYVTGFHVRPANGGATFDLYSDGSSHLFSDAEFSALGIAKKNWSLPPAETGEYTPAASAKALPERPVPIGPGVGLIPLATTILPLVDKQKALQDDAALLASGAKKTHRTAVFQNFEQTIRVDGEAASSGAWQDVPGGGSLWSVSILSPEAVGMRAHFASLTLPAGARVIVYNENNPVEALGPYTEPATNMTDFWSGTCFSEAMVIECYVPNGVGVAGVHIAIDKVTHQYVPMGDLAWSKAAWTKSAGSCNNDVTCSTAWATTATGIALYDGVDSSGGFYCTGTLLADTSNTGTPYFLTANHCVGSASTASTMEFFWLYQTSICGGTAPSMPTPQGGGATLLATTTEATGTDFCLVRMNSLPPSGVSYVGWSSSTTTLGTATVCIHHPSADYKRISFGSVTSNSPLDEPALRFYQNSWSSGVTEPGSSGSPLMTVSGHKVIGQLYGGPSACGESAANLVDYFGRFDKSYTLVQSYLNALGALQVTITPAAAVTAGAQWRADGGAWQSSGTTLSSVTLGSHTVDFSTVTGWTTPASQNVTISNAVTTTATGTYVVVAATGSVQVTIAPSEAVTAGAQWRLDSGSWQASGATVSNVSVGQHTVDFKAVSGWTTPSSQTFLVTGGATWTASGTYVVIPPTGSVSVTISPAGAITAGAQWMLDSGSWQNSGVTISGVSVGQHTVAFKTVSGWTTPSSQSIAVSNGATASAGGTYVVTPPNGALTVSLGPIDAVNVGGQWRVDGGDWQGSGATVSLLSVGAHTVSFKAVAGWNAPADQVVNIADGQTTTASGTYTSVSPSGSLQVTIEPAEAIAAGALWRVDGGAWQASDALVGGLAAGEHTVDFGTASIWTAPASQTVTIAVDTTATTSGLYILFADVNSDNAVDASDIQLIINAALGVSVARASEDLNGDNVVDAVDIQLVINAALGIVSQ